MTIIGQKRLSPPRPVRWTNPICGEARLMALRLSGYARKLKAWKVLVAIPGVEAPARWILPKKLGFY